MILPSKHLPEERALLSIGALILDRIPQPRTLSALWEELRNDEAANQPSSLSYALFVLALDLLYLLGTIGLSDGLLMRRTP